MNIRIFAKNAKPKIYLLWDTINVLLSFLVIIEIPLRLVFGNDYIGHSLLALHLVATAVFSLDIVLTWKFPHHHHSDDLLRKKNRKKNWQQSWFWFDLVSALPLEIIFNWSAIYSLHRLLRLHRIFRFIGLIRESNLVNPAILRLGVLIIWIFLSAHYIACGWMWIEAPREDMLPVDRYVRAIYWTMTTMTTIGYGDVTPQGRWHTLYVVLIEIIGAGMYGFVIGNIASLVANIDIAKAQYQEKLEKINTFMKFRSIPPELQGRIHDYYTYLWESRRGYDESSVLAELPTTLKIDISLYLNREILEKVPLFKGASEELLREIILSLHPIVYTPGDYVFRQGERGASMYFISRGTVEVVSPDGETIYATLSDGSFFGEIALLLNQPRTASIRAADYCDLYMLEKSTFDRIIRKYPVFAAYVQNLASERQQSQVQEQNVRKNSQEKLHYDLACEAIPGGVTLSWLNLENASGYEVERRAEGHKDWQLLAADIAGNSFSDLEPVKDSINIYRVRAIIDHKPAVWSREVSVNYSVKNS